MANAQADEVPFLSGMERKPEAVPEEPGWHETKVTVDGRKLFQGDGMMWQLLRKIRLALSMVSEPERGPDDFERPVNEDRLRWIIRQEMQASPRTITYANGDSGQQPKEANGEKRLLTWILGVVGALLVGGIGGGIVMYGKLSSIEKGQDGHEQRINRLEADRDQQRYRGSNTGTP